MAFRYMGENSITFLQYIFYTRTVCYYISDSLIGVQKNSLIFTCVLCLVAQLCLTLCNPMHYSTPGSSVLGNSPGNNIGVSCHALLQGIFPTQGSNPVFTYVFLLYLVCVSYGANFELSKIFYQLYSSFYSLLYVVFFFKLLLLFSC